MGFPRALSGLSTDHLLDVFEAAPGRVRRALDGLPEDALGARPFAGKWSVGEIVAHLADAETIGAGRIRKILAEPGSTLPVYDEAIWARVLGYADLPASGLTDALTLFVSLRAVTGRLLRTIAPDAWQRTGLHPRWGEVSVRQLLELYADHGERHLAQIAERRERLGRPIHLESLLDVRLY